MGSRSQLGTIPTPAPASAVLNFDMSFKSIWEVVKQSATEWTNDNAPRLGAALSYYTIFAIPPLLVILIFIASQVLDPEKVQHALMSQVGGLIGKKGADTLQSALTASSAHGKGLLASIMAVAALVATATGLFIELQSALNSIWGVEEKPNQGVWGFIKNRLLSFAMVVCIGFLLLVSLVVSAGLTAAAGYLHGIMPGLNILTQVLNIVVSLGVVTVLFAMIFKILPDVKIAWRDVWLGAGLTALLFTGGKFALGIYLGSNSSVSAYGVAGSVVLMLLWVYYSAQILFFGAELTQVLANCYGVRLQPKAHARWVNTPQAQQKRAPDKKKIPVKKPLPTHRDLVLNQIRYELDKMRTMMAHLRKCEPGKARQDKTYQPAADVAY